jgi:phospholipid transport system substrate-binding protein
MSFSFLGRFTTRFTTRLLGLLLLCGVLAAPLPSHAAPADPAAFVSDLGKRAINALTSSQAEADREKAFRTLFDEGFDLQAIGRFVLGPYWRTATEEQRTEFLTLFETYVVHSYGVRFGEYSGQQLTVQGSRPQGDDAAVVSSQIVQPQGAPPIKVGWQLSKGPQGYKITDVNVEGVSMAVTPRQEFASIIQRNGGQLDALIKLLHDKTSQI